ncbi:MULTISPECIES: DUF1490 family protein [Mycobacterium]|uniref:Uncharacterized protein n=2 Tax=Mycobacterium TaxID=1763 RepID=A0AAD1H2U4_MYCXE|nr:hypothetical protein BS641_12725 [Mycobacterium avium subsp. hominissuis]MCA2239422.1 DUF1490 family protein [Mycobacterium avium]MCA2359328.1 DUF1490 family protein [Mycobacterium intracellulare]SPX78360.1 Protein of uncharacterised function (DUF1490) [Mycobacterium xenopi]MBZ4551615.1 DUF1490 family protein [Mycobacterium avium subsp. hominissuis]
MVKHGLSAKAAPTAGFVGAAAFEAVGRAWAKVPWREATVSASACGLRVAREAQKSVKRARLAVVDVVAEARERVGEEVEEEVAPPAVAEPAPRKRPGKAAKRPPQAAAELEPRKRPGKAGKRPPQAAAELEPRKRPGKAGKRPPQAAAKSGDDHHHGG